MQALPIESLRIFRNLSQVLVEPHPRFNVFHGDNAQGKTNLLEAVYLLGTLRSFRAAKTEELLRFGSAARRAARVAQSWASSGCSRSMCCGGLGKSARCDGKCGAAAAQYFGGFNVVLFAPRRPAAAQGSAGRGGGASSIAPSGTRTPDYPGEVQIYERILRLRNARSCAMGDAAPSLLEVYDLQLAKAAVPLVTRRRALVAELLPFVQRAFERVTQTGLTLEISYQGSLAAAEGELAAELSGRLAADRRRDLARGATSSGPHTDELRLILNGRAAASFASQGQLRAMVLALKIAEIEYT